MSARQRRLWWAAGIVGALAAGVTIVYVWATQSVNGRRWLLAQIVSAADGTFKGRGTLRVSTLREISWGRVHLDSVAILDTAGVPVVQATDVTGSIDFPALLDKHVHITSLVVRGLSLDLHKNPTGPWNFSYILSGDGAKSIPGLPGYGDNIRVDTLRLTNGTITTVAPWSPHPIFKGAARDSVIAVRDSLHDLLHTPQGLFERRRVVIDRLVAHNGIITQPYHRPSSMDIDSLRGAVSDPPIRIMSAAGHVIWTPDSLRLNLPSLALPASVGSASGLVWWSQPGAVRYDVTVKADAGLSDLTWIWDVLPKVGRGTANIRLRTLESADDAEYALSNLDVTSEGSHVTGHIDVVARPADLILRRVDLAFTPLKSALARRLSYGVLPDTVNGVLQGRLVAATGGTLKNFLIDRLDATFTDAYVPGAVSSMRANGSVTFGAAPAARNVVVQALSADLRTARTLMTAAPNVDGTLSGSLRIASADLRNADLRDLALTWTDGTGNMSGVRGNARVGYGLKVPTIEAAIALDPVSMRALARIDTTLGIRSDVRGDVTASGTLDSLIWHANLHTDSSSRVAFDGIASLQKSTWRVTANGVLTAFDTRAWIGRGDVPTTAISGTVRIAAAGTRDSVGTMLVADAKGDVNVRQVENADQPAVDLLASGSLDANRLHVDSATVHIGGVTMDAHGVLARYAVNGVATDTMEVSARADTLDLVRRQLSRLAATVAPFDSAGAKSLRQLAADTLSGDASVSGYLVGSVADFDATLALGARDVQIGALRVGRVFGSLVAKDVRTRAAFEGVATADEIDGLVGSVRIASAEFRVQQASPDSGQLILDASSPNNAHLVVRGGYQRRDGATVVVADSLRFGYDSVTWRNMQPIRVVSDGQGLRIDSLELRSSARGLVALRADLPTSGPVQGAIRLDRFPVGEAVAFALASKRFSGLLSGDAAISGTRAAPLINWRLAGDSLGMSGNYLPHIASDGTYADRKLVAQAVIVDTLGGRLMAAARVPVDLSIATVDKRLLSDSIDIDVTADSLRLDGLNIAVAGASKFRGAVAGAVMIHGTVDRPVATGSMTLNNFSVLADQLGIEPYEGRAVIRAVQDSLILESFRVRSGRASDTLSATGALRFARNEPTTIIAQLHSNNAVLARMKDGTDLVLSGDLAVKGLLSRPDVSGTLFIPSATLVIDPLGASTALDLSSATAREYLSPSETPVLKYASKSIAQLGELASVSNARVELGDEVWVRTPEANVKVTGVVSLATVGNELVPEGTISANRGQYRLDLGVVSRSFSVDSGTVRFYGESALAPALNINATNVVRLASGDEIPVGVRIGGTIDAPVVTLSSSDPLYSSAPESEIISLLIFGAPTFALDGQSQSTVRAVTGVLLPTIGGAVEGKLQQLLPIFNTVQVTTAGGQTRDDLNAYSLLDNLSITAGKQIGEKTFLRLNTGVCRGSGQSIRGASIWGGVSAEYRFARGLTGQVGVDPGSSPCSRLGGDLFPRLQFGFDLFREWIF